MTSPLPLASLDPRRFESVTILKGLAAAHRRLAELKGVAQAIPNQGILIDTLSLQEAKDSSAVENIVTTHDELYRDGGDLSGELSPATKEVLRYRQALRTGFERVHESGLLSIKHILEIQAELERNTAGFRKLPGTTLQNATGHVVYTPPPPNEIHDLMGELERFLNDDNYFAADPLVKMALAHHQFESIHPFYDGNGRTGRIINVLYLVRTGLLDIPVLYLSREIVRSKRTYYSLLQSVRDKDTWEDWVSYILTAVERTAEATLVTVQAIKRALMDYKHRIRRQHRFYSQDLINNLFRCPYTKIDFIEQNLKVSRLTARKYLEVLVKDGFLEKRKIGRTNYYINIALFRVLTRAEE